MQQLLELKLWTKKPVRILLLFFSFLLLFCVVKILIPCRTYQYEGSCSFEEEISTRNTVIYDRISLRPGVYRVELEYETDTDPAAVCNVQDGTVFTGGLLSNGEHMYSGLGKTGYDIWLYERTENLQVVVSYDGRGSLVTGNLKITETNQLWTMLLTIVVFVGLLLFCLQVFYYYNKEFPISARKKHVFFPIMVISLVASIPYLCEYNITGADLTYHLQRIEGVKDGILGGQFPVRLEPRWVYDHGYANAIFYCNTFLYFPALLRLLGFTVSASYNAYCIVLNIATAWISYFCFSKIFQRHHIGIVCSALYTLSVFRIYKLIITSATGEGTAVTFIPLVLYGLYRIFTEEPEEENYKTAWIPLMLGVSGLIQSHVLTCEVTAGVIFLFCLVCLRRLFRRNTIWELAKAALASLLLSLWFLVPFLDYYITQDVHIKHVSGRTIQDRGLYFAQLAFHFWTTGDNAMDGESGMQFSHPVGIGLVLIVALGIFLILWYSNALRKKDEKSTYFVKRAAVIGLILLFMSMNIFPWDRIQSLHPVTATLVSSLQFPNRFLGWGTACLVLVFGFCMKYFEDFHRRGYRIMVLVAVMGITTSSMYLLDFVNRDQEYFELYNEESMGFGYISGAEYLIQGTDESKLSFAKAVAGEGVEITDYEKKYLHVELRCRNLTDTEGFIDIPLLLYKGYRAVDTDTGQKMQVCAGENNVVRVLIPAGFEGEINVDFRSPIYWRIGEIVSLATVILLLITGWKRKIHCIDLNRKEILR
ncbi:MAG: hypothetical protein HFH87_05905 [Lachnospiraceae bacterium]|nr:hypothetical protein [Lachnospiraceae bacterium]